MRKFVLAVALPAALAAGCSRPSDEPAARDLTLLTTPESSATSAVVSARELIRSPAEPLSPAPAGTAARLRLVPVRAPAKAAAPRPEPAPPAPVPNAEVARSRSPEPAPAPVAAAAGAGMALEPGQSVTVVSAGASAGPAQLPPTELISSHEMAGRRIIIIGDDRCVPGRGELLPGLRHRH